MYSEPFLSTQPSFWTSEHTPGCSRMWQMQRTLQKTVFNCSCCVMYINNNNYYHIVRWGDVLGAISLNTAFFLDFRGHSSMLQDVADAENFSEDGILL